MELLWPLLKAPCTTLKVLKELLLSQVLNVSWAQWTPAPTFVHLLLWPPPGLFSFFFVFPSSFHLDIWHVTLSRLSQLASLISITLFYNSPSSLLLFLGHQCLSEEARDHILYGQVVLWSNQTPLTTEEYAEQIDENIAQLCFWKKKSILIVIFKVLK